jgi:hypothetical protein
MKISHSAVRRAVGLALLLAVVTIAASSCVFVPVGGPGYAAPPVVYGGPPPVVVGPRYGGWRYRHYYW